MSGSLSALLRALHEAHQRVYLLHKEIDEFQQAERRLELQLAEREKQLRQLQEEVRQLKVTLHEREVTEKQLQEKVTRWQQQILAASTAREYQALQNQIENARLQLSALEDEMLELIDKLERRQQELPQREQAVAETRQELHRLREQRRDRLTWIQERLAQAQADVAQLETQLPQELLETYQRLVRHGGKDALAAVEHGSCMGCFTETTLHMLQQLRLNRPVVCKSCGRILYLVESE
ncbi:MAG: hypothetical protein RMI91_04215 [Gemmatales bacterium]|nr:hypothetical protein [Gemmatales bacterium]MDW7993839.1 hypothetical protein [Gemmatales bacterium]